MTGIHQVIAGGAPRDAITTHALQARLLLREQGLQSEIFCNPAHLSAELANEIHPHQRWGDLTTPGDIAILHYSIDSVAFEYVLDAGAVGAIQYHNITPADLLWAFAPDVAQQCRDGRLRLRALAHRVRAASADSEFNAQELRALDFPDPALVGILRADAPTGGGATRATVGSARPRILFVGRGIPNKRQDDCILAMGALRQAGFDAELRLVGGWGGSPAYEVYCRSLVDDLFLDDCVSILGSVSDEDLAAEYAHADVFLCLSEHEGYCVPIIEALEANVPIVALPRGAVAETVGKAGLLLDSATPSLVAEAIMATLRGEVTTDGTARDRQLAHHGATATGARFLDFARSITR